MIPETKTCVFCGRIFARSARRSKSAWDKRKYCSTHCSTLVQLGDERDEFVPHADQEVASANLLRSLLRYGFRHDGLPGLPADRFHELAREHGVQA